MDKKDLFSIIDEYDSQTFEACREKLYKHLNYKVLSKEDVRPIDIKEKIVEFFATSSSGIKIRDQFECTYASLVENILNSHIVSRGVRDLNYRKAADNNIALLEAGKGSIATLENLVLVFISQFREFKKISEKSESDDMIPIVGADYYLSSNDVNIVDFIYRKINYCSQEPKKFHVGKKKDKLRKLTPFEKKLLYIITILVMYRVLQYEGEI